MQSVYLASSARSSSICRGVDAGSLDQRILAVAERRIGHAVKLFARRERRRRQLPSARRATTRPRRSPARSRQRMRAPGRSRKVRRARTCSAINLAVASCQGSRRDRALRRVTRWTNRRSWGVVMRGLAQKTPHGRCNRVAGKRPSLESKSRSKSRPMCHRLFSLVRRAVRRALDRCGRTRSSQSGFRREQRRQACRQGAGSGSGAGQRAPEGR